MAEQTDVLHNRAERKALEVGAAEMWPIIEKELIHYDIFKALSDSDFMRNFVFQGGTCLRLCHGSPRFSEDLDFSLGTSFHNVEKHQIKKMLEEYLYSKYSQKSIVIKEPNSNEVNQGNVLSVDHWEIRINTTPSRRDLPLQRIHFEAASVPAYTGSLREVQINYPELEDEFSGIKVWAESLEEICADKIVSLARAEHEGRMRWRDLWDLPWIMGQESFSQDTATRLVEQKVRDYHCENDFNEALLSLREKLPRLVESGQFQLEMRRFLIPGDLKDTVGDQGYRKLMLSRLDNIYDRVEEVLNRGSNAIGRSAELSDCVEMRDSVKHVEADKRNDVTYIVGERDDR